MNSMLHHNFQQCISLKVLGAAAKQDVHHGNAALQCDPTKKEDVTAEGGQPR